MIAKAPENEEIAEFTLTFTESEEYSTTLTHNGAAFMYTPSTLSVDITAKVAADERGAAIVKASNGIKLESSGSSLWWIWVLAAVMIGLMLWFIMGKTRKDKETS